MLPQISNRALGLVYVANQVLAYLYLLISAPVLAPNLFIYILYILGIGLAVWAAWEMYSKAKLRVMPQPAAETALVTSGPYRWIRHPMYTALMLGATGHLLQDITLERTGVFIILGAVLYFKARFEEELMVEQFPFYADYMQSTKRFIPFIA